MKTGLHFAFNCLLLAMLMTGCSDSKDHSSTATVDSKPKATGDAKAIELAQKVIDASGGLENFERIPYISFNYFDRRYWFWDKINSRYRVESESRNLRIAGKLDGSETHLWLRGNMVTDPDTIDKYSDFAYKAWVNDTYWLLFPFKLLDKGVHLRYLDNCMTDSMTSSACIELTFDSVGVTPDNKYIAYIDTLKNEIVRWDYFRNKNDSIPSLSNPWNDYRKYGNIIISGGRGNDTISEIAVYGSVAEELFNNVAVPFTEIPVR